MMMMMTKMTHTEMSKKVRDCLMLLVELRGKEDSFVSCDMFHVLQVTVMFVIIPSTAVLGVDYTLSSDHVSLADGESMKLIPITLIPSTAPKLARGFTIRLLNSTTGGAAVGHPAECIVTIQETADAHGIFGNIIAFAC